MKRSLLLTCLFAVGMTAFAQKSVKPATLSLKEGQSIKTVTNTDMTMNIDMMGQSMENTTTTKVTSAVDVKAVTDTGYLLSTTVSHMVMHASAMGQEIDFDSDKEEDMNGQIGAALKGRIGQPVEMSIDKEGIITSAPETEQGGGLAGAVSSGQMVEGQPFPLFIAIKGGKKKIGESWMDSTASDDAGKMVTTYTLKSIEKGQMIVSYTGTLAKKGTMETNGMQLDMDLKGTTSGESTYLVATGMLLKSAGKINMSGEMSVMGQSVPLTTVTNISMEVLED